MAEDSVEKYKPLLEIWSDFAGGQYPPQLINFGWIQISGVLTFFPQLIFLVFIIRTPFIEKKIIRILMVTLALINIIGSTTDIFMPMLYSVLSTTIFLRLNVFFARNVVLLIQWIVLMCFRFLLPQGRTKPIIIYLYSKITMFQLTYPILILLVFLSYVFQMMIRFTPITTALVILGIVPLFDIMFNMAFLKQIYNPRSISAAIEDVEMNENVNKIARSTISTSTIIASVNL